MAHILLCFGMESCSPVCTPFRSGYVINRILLDSPFTSHALTDYQLVMGALNWLTGLTRPDISAVLNLLAQFTQSPHSGRMASAKCVLHYLAGTSLYGICFSERHALTLHAYAAWPWDGTEVVYTNAGWGPQDALHPPKDPARAALKTVTVAECRSLCGYILARCAGLILWGVIRMRKVTHSFCEAEIVSMDEGCKFVEHHRHVLADLDCNNASLPTLLYNDNKEAVDWSGSQSNRCMRHFNIRKSAVRECHEAGVIAVEHLPRDVNPADLFTREQQHEEHFFFLCDTLLSPQ